MYPYPSLTFDFRTFPSNTTYSKSIVVQNYSIHCPFNSNYILFNIMNSSDQPVTYDLSFNLNSFQNNTIFQEMYSNLHYDNSNNKVYFIPCKTTHIGILDVSNLSQLNFNNTDFATLPYSIIKLSTTILLLLLVIPIPFYLKHPYISIIVYT